MARSMAFGCRVLRPASPRTTRRSISSGSKDVTFGRRLSDEESQAAALPDQFADSLEAAVPVMRFLATLGGGRVDGGYDAAVGDDDRVPLSGPSHRGSADSPALTRGFLFADLRDYTAYVERHGDQAAAELLGDYRAIVRDAMVATGGGEVRTEGDSFYIVFSSVGAAVRCGLAIVAEAARASAERADRPIRVGVGVHAGESVAEGDGFVGSAVNIAARICAVAAPGEVLVSDTVRSLVRTSLPLSFRSRGRPRLKGIAEPIELFAVTPAGEPAAARAPTPTARPSRRRLVVVGTGALLIIALAGPLGASVLLRLSEAGNPGSSPAAGASSAGASGGALIDLAALPGRILFRSTPRVGTGAEAGRQVQASDFDGTSRQALTPLTQDVLEFKARPDGAQIAYMTAQGELGLVSSNGRDDSRPWPGPWPLEDFYKGGPLAPAALYGWLPSGELLLESRWDLASPSKVRLAANGMSAVPFGGGCGDADVETGEDLAVSPDASLVAFRQRTHLWLAPSGSCAIQLTKDLDSSEPAWSRDGNRIAFRGNSAAGATDIWVMNVNGTGLRQLNADPVPDSQPTWSPDGAFIAWSRGVGDTARLWVMRDDGTGSRVLPIGDQGEQVDEPLWLADASTVANSSPTPVVPNPFSIISTYSADQLDLDQPIALAIGPNGDVYITDAHPAVTVVDAFGARVARWGTLGSGAGQFDLGPPDNLHGSIAVGPDGRVYVSDSRNTRVEVFGPTGKFLRQFGIRGSGDGHFLWPFDLSADASGNVYVLDDQVRNLQKFSPIGVFLWRADKSTLPDMTGHGHNADIDAKGRIVIGNDDTGRVLYLDQEGRELDAFDGQACGATVDAAGNTYVTGCGSDAIEVFDPAHRLVGRWSGPTMPLDGPPEFGPNGEVFALGKDGSLIRLSIALPTH